MRYIKYITPGFRYTLLLCVMVIISVSCKKDVEGINFDQKSITDKQLEMDANEGGVQLPGMQLGIQDVLTTWKYQMQSELSHDNYAGYVGSTIKNNVDNTTYARVDAWDIQTWYGPTSLVLDQWVALKKKGFDTKYPDLFSIGIIFKVFAGHRHVDTFGPIPYSLYGTSSDVKFDSEEEAYDLFFNELKNAVEALKKAESDNPGADKIRYAKFDRSRFGGDYAKWIRVANTLRLRLAMRIVKVNPTKAKEEAEAAVADEGGLITTAEGSFEMSTGTVHPQAVTTNDWNESGINAAIVSFLDGYNDPRLTVYAKPSAYDGSILGIRSGLDISIGDYEQFSRLNFDNNPYVKLMDVSESYFLRAEGALRGWNMGGTAKQFYEEGVRASFESNKVGGVDDYLNDDISTPEDYTDPLNPVNNAAALTSITVKWDDAATEEEKLERLITQKWIAMYPEGYEAWAEFRRTGYPKLWPVVKNNSGGTVPGGDFIKRIPYPTTVRNASKAAVESAIQQYLSGSDDQFQPVWWDAD